MRAAGGWLNKTKKKRMTLSETLGSLLRRLLFTGKHAFFRFTTGVCEVRFFCILISAAWVSGPCGSVGAHECSAQLYGAAASSLSSAHNGTSRFIASSTSQGADSTECTLCRVDISRADFMCTERIGQGGGGGMPPSATTLCIMLNQSVSASVLGRRSFSPRGSVVPVFLRLLFH